MLKIHPYIIAGLLLILSYSSGIMTPLSGQHDTALCSKMSRASSSSIEVLYISIYGDDASEGTIIHPLKTLKYAVTKAQYGCTIRLSAGVFIEEGLIEVPPGVSIQGAGRNLTILKSSSNFYYHPPSPNYSTNKFLVSLTALRESKGNQRLSSFTIDGDLKQLHGGIYVNNLDNIEIDSIKVINTNFTGIWLWSVKESKLLHTQLTNCSWGSSSYCSGALNLGNLENVDIRGLELIENTGYGIKAIGPNGNNNLKGVKIHDSHISVSPTGLWNNGTAPNIALEFWQVSLVDCEIYNTYLDNTISLVNSNMLPSNGIRTIRIHNNIIDMDTRSYGNGYGIELTINDVEIDSNYFIKGTQGIVNWSSPMKNWKIHHNTFYALQGIYPGEVLRSQWSGLHNVKLYNNTIEFDSDKTMNVVGLYGGVSDSLDIINNLFINSNTRYNYYPNSLVHLENGAIINSVNIMNNCFSKMPVEGFTGNYFNNLTIDPLITKVGARPLPYYILKIGSPLIDAGIDVGFPFLGKAPDIGANELK